jgi:putative ABC transport system permease protein
MRFGHDLGGIQPAAPGLHPWWKLQGQWPGWERHGDYIQVVLGAQLAKRLGLKTGDAFALLGPEARQAGVTPVPDVQVTGIVTTGDTTDNEALVPLGLAQSMNGTPDAVSRVDISARTKPEDAFARVDPDSLPAKQKEIWYCRPYANSIAYQIREAIPGAQAEQVRRVEQSEGTVLERISGLMWLVSAAALLAAGFAVSAAMATAVLERQGEIGLMRSLGASKGAIAMLFYAETGVLALLAGVAGYLLGSGLAAWLGARIFTGDGAASVAVLNPVLLPVVVAMALVVAIAGSTPAIRAALHKDPSAILRADA